MQKSNTFQRVIWAVDPFAEDPSLQRRTAETLNALLERSETPVYPVSLVYYDDSISRKGLPTASDLTVMAKTSVDDMVKSFELNNVAPVEILVQTDRSLGNAVKALLRHGKKLGCDLIAVGTQAKKGATQFLLGSFAETLILNSEIPVLIVSPQTKFSKKIEEILFPADLSDKSKDAYSQVLQLAKQVGAKIRILHRVEYPTVGPVSLVPAFSEYYNECKQDIAKRQGELDEMAKRAKEAGVRVELCVKSEGAGTVDAICELTENAPGTIVAMVSRTSGFEALLLGSKTRQVIRRCLSPIWVIHPKGEK